MPAIEAYRGAPRRILIIDDSAICRHLLVSLLSSEGVEVLEAVDGRTGLEAGCSQRPDLILLDLALPDCTGFEALHRFKTEPATQSIPVVFLSGQASTADKARALDLGAVDFIAKPFEAVELRARIRAALRMKELQDLLEQRAHVDGLTGLGNRLALEERLESAWEQCQRRDSPLTVLLADLDHFKRINDRHGHVTGDEVLRRAAVVLREAVRAGDFVGRFGGEEFVVVAPDCDLEGGIALAERFRQRIAAPLSVGHDLGWVVTTSVGVATETRPGSLRPEVLLWRADRALYQAKAAGRNAVWSWDAATARPVPTLVVTEVRSCPSSA